MTVEICTTIVFDSWFKRLRDRQAHAKIMNRIDRVRHGNFGDIRPVGEGVSELRIDYGPGYRVYFIQKGAVLVLLLCGGDKRTQDKDIVAAKKMAKTAWEDQSWI